MDLHLSRFGGMTSSPPAAAAATKTDGKRSPVAGVRASGSGVQGQDCRQEVQDTTYVYTDVQNFRTLVQELTGNSSRARDQTPKRLTVYGSGDSRRESTVAHAQIPNLEVVDGGRPSSESETESDTATLSLFQWKSETKKQEAAKQQLQQYPTQRKPHLNTPHPIAKLNIFNTFSENGSGSAFSRRALRSEGSAFSLVTPRAQEIKTHALFPITPTFGSMNGYTTPPLQSPTLEKPTLLQLFPLHPSAADC